MPRRYDDDDEEFDDDEDDLELDRRPRRRNSRAASRLMGPGISLMVVAGVSFVVFMVACPINLFTVMNKPEIRGKEAERIGNYVGAGVCMPLLMIGNVVVAIGGYLMYSQRSYGMAMTAAILAVLPCFSPCYLLGIPFGIWALIVLFDPEVKEAFRA